MDIIDKRAHTAWEPGMGGIEPAITVPGTALPAVVNNYIAEAQVAQTDVVVVAEDGFVDHGVRLRHYFRLVDVASVRVPGVPPHLWRLPKYLGRNEAYLRDSDP